MITTGLAEYRDIMNPRQGSSLWHTHQIPMFFDKYKTPKEKKLHTVGFLGKGGGDAIKLVDHPILIPSQSTARVQEMHIMDQEILAQIML